MLNKPDTFETFDRKKLAAAARRLCLMFSKADSYKRLVFTPGQVSASGTVGKDAVAIKSEARGRPTPFSINAPYLIAALEHIAGDQVTIGYVAPEKDYVRSPLSIRGEAEDTVYSRYVMPMMLER